MNRHSSRQPHPERLLTLLSFGLFALCVLAVLLSGAQAYRRLAARDQAQYLQRTCAQYLATKVRQASGSAALSCTSFGDGDALLLSETVEGEAYTTLIYCSGGWLRELFTYDPASACPEDGEAVLEAQSLALALEDGLLTAKISDPQGDFSQIILSLRSGEVPPS